MQHFKALPFECQCATSACMHLPQYLAFH